MQLSCFVEGSWPVHSLQDWQMCLTQKEIIVQSLTDIFLQDGDGA